MPSIFQVRDKLFKTIFLDPERGLNFPLTKTIFLDPERGLNFPLTPLYETFVRRDYESFVRSHQGLPEGLSVFQGLAVGAIDEASEEIVLFTTCDPDAIDLNRIFHAADVPAHQFPSRIIRTGIFTSAARPAMGGDSVSFEQKSTGTIAARVRDTFGKYAILSCNHVLADLNRGVKGKDEIWAPGDKAGGTKNDRLGVLRDFAPIIFGGTVPNQIDAALGDLDSSNDLDPGIRGLGLLTAPNTNPKLNTSVTKVGWSTGKTTGKLRFRNMGFINVFANGATALFEGQYGIIGGAKGYFAQRGDSGSLVVDDTKAPVGLLVSVATGMDIAIMNPIEEILTYFNIEFA